MRLATLCRSLAVCLLGLLMGACGPQKPIQADLPADLPLEPAREAPAQPPSSDELTIAKSMLDLIEDPHLHSLVDEALANNPDLGATARRLLASGYLARTNRAARRPQVQAGFETDRNNRTLDPQTGGTVTAGSHRLSLSVGWELDLWGRLADEIAATEGDLEAQRLDYRFAREALAARVIQTWIEQTAVRRVLTIERERVAVLERFETIVLERYRNGLENLDALSTARSRTELARADLSAREQAARESVRRLEVLLGRYPEGALHSETAFPVIEPAPRDVAAAVLLERPDVAAALERLRAARYRARASEKAKYPELRLSGQVFRDAASLDSLGSAGNAWTILGSLFHPVFNGGSLHNRARAQQSEAEAALLDLRAVVLGALEETARTFDLETGLAEQARSLQAAVTEAAGSSAYFEERYR